MKTPSSVSVEEIVAAALKVGAERVCFRVNGEFVFCEPSNDMVRSVVEERRPERYKLQRQVGRRWEDVSKYVSLGTGVIALDQLRGGDLAGVLKADMGSLKAAVEQEPRRYVGALRNFNSIVATKLDKEYNVEVSRPARDALEYLATGLETPHGQFLAASLDTINSLVSRFPISRLLDGKDTEAALDVVDRRVEQRPALYGGEAARVSAAVNRGKLLSAVSRADAAAEFALARTLDTSDVIRDLYVDMGVWTYFDEVSIGAAARDFRASVQASIDAGCDGSAKNPLAVAFSVDAAYLRIYAPVLFHYAQQMPDVDYNIILCEELHAASEVLRDVEAFRKALAHVNRAGLPDNVRIHRIEVPVEVAEARTFYATARFFAVDRLLADYTSIYVMDVDLSTSEDPRPYLRRVAHLPFAVPRGHGFLALSPWRRHMAGNFAVNRSALESSILEDLQLYLAHGLTQRNSWMLDQNALLYAIERHPDTFVALDEFRRPFTQARFRSVWERNSPVAAS